MIERGALTLCAPSIAWKGKPILRTDDRLALLSPLTFAAGKIMMTVALTSGVTLVAVPGDTLASPAALKRCFLDNRITACFMTPTLYRTFHDFNPEMRGVVLGGEPVSDIESMDYDLYNMYGQSESGFVVAMQKINGTGAEATIGTPQAEGIRTQVLDEAGRPVQNGEVGELCYENPWFRGYVGLEAETQRVLRGGLVHSGDLCRRLSDGALSMIEHGDNLLKIHGLWYNPFEIESAIARCFDVDWVFVRILTESTKVFICVYYTGKATLSMADAREKLRGQLPDYLLPTHFYRLSRVPANRNGKVDHRELPSPTEASPTPGLISPDRLEREIGDIVNKAMDRPMSIGRDANLISLGLSSLTSIVIIGEIEEKTGIQLSLAGIMAHPDIAHICEAVKAALEQGCIRAEKQDTVEKHMDYLPLTKNQLAVFADSETSKGSTQYNLPAYFSFSRTEMDASRLEDAIRQVFYRHAVFRTRIVRCRDIPKYYRIEGCEVYQALSDEPLAIRHAHLERDFTDEALAKAHFQEMVRPFDLFSDRLYRIEIVETPGKLYLFFDMHHIIADGYSLSILADDISGALSGAPVPMERMTFFQYIARKVEAGIDEMPEREYVESLMAVVESFRYPCRNPDGEARPHKAAKLQGKVAVNEIAAYCGRNGLAQSSYFHAALLLTLYLLTGEKPYIATTYSGRGEHPETLMRTAGFFARSVPLVWSESDMAGSRGDACPDAFIRDIQVQIMETCTRNEVLYSDLPARTDVLLTFQGELGATYISRHRAVLLEPEYPIFPIHLVVKPIGASYEIMRLRWRSAGAGRISGMKSIHISEACSGTATTASTIGSTIEGISIPCSIV